MGRQPISEQGQERSTSSRAGAGRQYLLIAETEKVHCCYERGCVLLLLLLRRRWQIGDKNDVKLPI
jgi:hypothetical protein